MSDPRDIANAIDRLIKSRIKEDELASDCEYDPGGKRLLQAMEESQDALDELAAVLSH
jgi:hypothetical protein